MPQLDKVTFLSQFFWLCFFYIGFYFLILKFFLPKMTRILKLRKNKLSSSQEGVMSLQQENDKIRTSYETLLANGLSASRSAFNESFQRTEKWLHDMVENNNKTHFKAINKAYIYSVGEASLSQNLALNQVSSELPEKIYFPILLDKIKNLSKENNFSKISAFIKDKQDSSALSSSSSNKQKTK
jgi:F0F1-type ATP synthase membrane subunit b/b'